MRIAALVLGLLLSLSGCAAFAQDGSPIAIPGKAAAAPSDVNPFATRGADLPSALRWLQSENIVLTYLGDEGGIKAYLGESANGRFQTFYPTPDGDYLMVGLLFKAGGGNVTREQIGNMRLRFNEAALKTPGVDASQVPQIQLPEDTTEPYDGSIIDWFKSKGYRVSVIDSKEGGVTAFLVEIVAGTQGDNGKMQMFYQLPDQRYAVAGVLMQRGGVNVTGLQIGYLQQKFVTDQVSKQQNGSQISTSPNAPKVPTVSFDDSSSAMVSTASSSLPDPAVPPDDAPASAPGPQPVTSSSVEPASPPPSVAASSAVPSDTNVPVAPAPVLPDIQISTATPDAATPFLSQDIAAPTFMNDVNKSVFFTVGLKGKPAIYMVADPQCPFCHETWRTLKSLVFAGKIQVRVIMIAGLRGSDPIARAILSQPDPSKAWIAGEGSIPNTKIPDPPAPGTDAWNTAGQFLQINANFIQKYKITQTPFLGYVTPDNKVYVSRGVPKDFNSFLAALK